jgi:FAD synthetase
MPLRAPEQNDDKSAGAPVVNGHNATILPICAALATRVNTFLESEAPTPLLKDVQKQTKIALGVIDEALDRYRFASSRIRCHWRQVGKSGEG